MEATRVITKRGSKGQILAYKWLVDGKEVPEGFKYCPKCKTIKKKDEFSAFGNACKPCANQRSREHYANRKTDKQWREAQNEKGRLRFRKAKEQIVEHLGGKCFDCGNIFPNCCYDVHHLDPNEKDFNLSTKIAFDAEMKKELEKCVLLCSNCHRIRHFRG